MRDQAIELANEILRALNFQLEIKRDPSNHDERINQANVVRVVQEWSQRNYSKLHRYSYLNEDEVMLVIRAYDEAAGRISLRQIALYVQANSLSSRPPVSTHTVSRILRNHGRKTIRPQAEKRKRKNKDQKFDHEKLDATVLDACIGDWRRLCEIIPIVGFDIYNDRHTQIIQRSIRRLVIAGVLSKRGQKRGTEYRKTTDAG